MSGWGPRSNWYLNVRAGGAEWIEIGGASFSPEIRFPEEEEAIAILTAYEGRNRITAGLLGSILSRQVGFDYDGSPAARERLVRELPLVAFARPM